MTDKPPQRRPQDAPVGLRPYTSDDTLYGRDWERAELRDLLMAEQIVLLYAPSGAGKTSLVQAGLVADLRNDPRLHLIEEPIRIGSPLPRWAADLAKPPNRFLLSALLSLDLLDPEAPPQGGQIPELSVALAELSAMRPRQPVVLIFDQFEQILTEDPFDLAAREQFFAMIGALLSDSHYWALFVIREDYLAALDPYLSLIPRRMRARFRLDLLDYKLARDVLSRTAAETKVPLDSDAVIFLTDELRRVRPRLAPGDTPTRQSRANTQGDLGPYIEPVYLQAVYEQIWRRVRDQPGGAQETITDKNIAEYVDIEAVLLNYYDGRLAQALDELIEGALGDPPRKVRDIVSERNLRSWIEERLIRDGVRVQVRIGPDDAPGLAPAVIKALSNQYLLRLDPRRGAWAELAHDLLIEPVLRSNAAWVEANTRDFQRQAALWEQRGRDMSLLLLDRKQLFAARRWAEANPLDARDQQFIDESARHLRKLDASERYTDLAALGWGVFFHRDTPSDVREALRPLLEHRKAAIGDAGTYHEFSYADGFDAQRFLKARRVSFGANDPRKVPYYLLIVGGPEQIPFEFQYDLSLNQYAVGRLALDKPAHYAHYAARLIAAEREHPHRRTGAIFAPEYPNEPAAFQTFRGIVSASNQFREDLAQPLHERLTSASEADAAGWQFDSYLGAVATKAQLGVLLGGDATPSLLFAAAQGFAGSEGKAPPPNSLGSIVCADWPGLGMPTPDQYIAAADISRSADLAGLIAVLFVPYSAGATQSDDTRPYGEREKLKLAGALTSALSRRLLRAKPNPALALIAHVNLNWNFSFLDDDTRNRSDISLFLRCVESLQRGHTVGRALLPFSQRYWKLSLEIAAAVAAAHDNAADAPSIPVDTTTVALQLRARNDVRNYVILGDPAAHFAFEDDP